MLNNKPIYKRPKRSDVAKLAGVSVATVSYVVNNKMKPIASKTRQRVLDAIQKLGYRPHTIARSLKTGNTCTIGLVIPTISSPGMAYLASIVQDTLIERGYTVIIANTYEDPDLEEKMLSFFASQMVDGMIISPSSRFDGERIRQVIDEGIPVVFMDRFVEDVPIDTVTSNNIKATKQATEYLIQQGCKIIACLTFNKLASSAIDRVEGYRQALIQYKLPVDPENLLLINDPESDGAEEIICNFFNHHDFPDAILCNTQELGISLLRIMQKHHYPIPEGRVIIFDADWAKLLNPPLPVIYQDLKQIALTAVNLMIQRLQGDNSEPQKFLLEAKFVIE